MFGVEIVLAAIGFGAEVAIGPEILFEAEIIVGGLIVVEFT